MTIEPCECANDRFPGVFAWPCASDCDESAPWVERHDICDVFEDDWEAAAFIAKEVGGIVVLAPHPSLSGRRPAVYPWPKEAA